MAPTQEAKAKGTALLDSFKASSWQSRIAMAIVVALLLLLLVQSIKDPGQFVSQLLVGITNGAIIALIALGYTLVYGIVELINFAHGDNFMIGSFVGVTVLSGTFLGRGFFAPIDSGSGTGIRIIGVLLALVVAMLVCGLINVGIERVAYKPLRNSPRLAVLITAIGMSFILQNVGLVWKGSFQISFPSLISNSNALAGITDAVAYRWKDLFVVLVTIPLLLGLSYFIRSTRQGKAMRAVAQDKEAAAMLGINVNGTTVFDVGFRQGLFAFTAAVLGGIGNLAGAVVGGVLIGVIGSMSDQYVGVRWTDIVIFTVLILVLVFRPRGLLGDRSAVQGGGGE